jgi:hypothetical protein
MQAATTAMLNTEHAFVGDGALTLGTILQLRRAFGVAPWAEQANDDVLRVLDKAAGDNQFIAALTHRGSRALDDYHLTSEAKAALLSGDIRWVETHVGKLDKRQQTWLLCRLGQEIW